MRKERRQLLRLGAMLLFISTLLGLLIPAPIPNPAQWRAAHVTAILLGLLVIGQGLLWNELRLSDRARRITFNLIRITTGSVLLLVLSNALLNIPGPASTPGVQPQGVQVVVLVTLLLILVPSSVVSSFLVWRGLVGEAE